MVARVAVITHRRSDETRNALLEVLELCRHDQVEAVIPELEVEKYALDDAGSLATVVSDLQEEQVDFCIAIGGDGTILRAFSRFRDMQTPVLGINFGKVGFLSAIGPDDISGSLSPFFHDEYELLKLSLLDIRFQDQRLMALNDLVVHKPDGGSVIRLGYQVGEVELDIFCCDGMVVSTPAGSTAYNLSTGGPLVSLGLDACILTAIAPHTLQARSLVLGREERLMIRNHSLGADAQIYIDGRRAGDLSPDSGVSVSLAAEKAKLVQPPGADFYRKLRDKFIKPS